MAETRTVTINADGIQEREVAYVRYELNQQTDIEGQPTGRTRGGKITVKVKSKNDGNTEILEWMCDTYMSKNGVISFPDKDGGEMKRLSFKNGYVVQYAETYDDSNETKQWMYLQPIITQYFIDNKSEIWLLFLIAHSKR